MHEFKEFHFQHVYVPISFS